MQRKSQLALVLATIVSIFTLAVVPAAADQGSDSGGSSGSGDSSTTTSTDGTSDTSGSSSGDSSSSGQSGTDVETTSQTSDTSTEIENEVHMLEGKGKSLLQAERKNGKEHSEQQRQTACKAHQAEINTRVSNYSAAAQRHLGTFESILSKVQDFYTNKKLNVPNYSALLATAQSKQADAQTAVDALKALDVNIDCTQPDPAQSLATVKTAVSNARTALQAYRAAIKDVIVAVKGASTSQDKTSTTGGNE